MQPAERRSQKSQWKENHTVATLWKRIRSGLDRLFDGSLQRKPFSINTILYFGKRGRENQREMKPGDLQLKTTTSRLKYFISSERATKNQSTFECFNTFLSSQVFEQYVGTYELKAPSFRVFDPRGVTRINFTWQLVKFGQITVEIKLVKPIKFTLLQHVNHSHSPSDHHWLFYLFTRGLILRNEN